MPVVWLIQPYVAWVPAMMTLLTSLDNAFARFDWDAK
jgi:hypothetical protein